MNRETAEQVRDGIVAFFVKEYGVTPDFFMADHTHEEIAEGAWSLCWEGWRDEYGNEWTTVTCNAYMSGKLSWEPDKILLEPIMGCILGIYDLEGYWEAQEGLEH